MLRDRRPNLDWVDNFKRRRARTMADLVADATKAPKQALGFAEDHLVAFLFILALALVLFTFAEAQRPGVLTGRVARLPFVGPAIVKRRIA